MFLRVGFAVTWFYLAVVASDVSFMLIFNGMSILALYIRTVDTLIIVRSFRLLLWLFIPTIILHAFFTPGTYITMPFYLSVSIEGLERSVFLCLKVMSIFFAALFIAKLIRMDEFMFLIIRFPKLDSFLRPYLLLLLRLRDLIRKDILQQKNVWKKQGGKWLQLPDMFVLSLISMLQQAKNEANTLWHDWDDRVLESIGNQDSLFKVKKSDVGLIIMALMAVILYG